MANNIHQKLSEFTAIGVNCDHPAEPKSGDVVRVGTIAGIALTNEEFGYGATGYRKQLGGISIDQPYNPATNSRVPDGTTPVSFQLNVWRVPVKNSSSGDAAPVGSAVYYQDAGDPTCVVNKSGAAQAFVGTLQEALATDEEKTVPVLLQAGGGPVDLT